MRHLALLATAGLAALASPASADPLDRSRVPATARWVVHLDVEAALGSSLVQGFLQNAEIEVELDRNLAEFRRRTGLDPRKDLYGITLFGQAQDPERGVVLLSTSTAAEGALTLLPELTDGEVDVSAGLVDGYEVSSIGGGRDGERMFVHPVRSADGARATLIAAKDPALLGEAIRTVRGQGTSLAAAMDPALAARPHASSILFAATADNLGRLDGVKPASQVARLAQELVLDLGEERGSLVGHLALTAASAEDARNMGSVLQGAIALVNLAAAEEPEAKPFLELLSRVRFETTERTVTASFACEVDALMKLVGELKDDGRHEGSRKQRREVRSEKRYEFEY